MNEVWPMKTTEMKRNTGLSTYPRSVIYELGQRFRVITNIRKADVTETQGWVLLELEGEEDEIDRCLQWALDIGVDVGPDIADTRTKTPDALLVDILNPNQAIDSNYINYLITTKSGKSLTGIIAMKLR